MSDVTIDEHGKVTVARDQRADLRMTVDEVRAVLAKHGSGHTLTDAQIEALNESALAYARIVVSTFLDIKRKERAAARDEQFHAKEEGTPRPPAAEASTQATQALLRDELHAQRRSRPRLTI